MALITVNAVVNVVPDALVVRIRLTLRVAVRARKHGVVVRVRMTGGANSVRPTVVRREVCVIESGVEPARSRMAGGTGSREARAHVIRIGRPTVVLLMTTVAVRRQRCVVVVYVATCTSDARVRSRQGEAGIVVVEGRR